MNSPTVILVHAAFADASSWNKVAPLLLKSGFPVVTPALPLTSLSDDAAALRASIARTAGPVVLAVHSYGGAVITAAAAGVDKVRALVYVAAMAPDAGETVAELLQRAPAHPQGPQLAPDADGFISMSTEGFTNAVAPDSTSEEIAEMVRTQKPISVAAITEPMGHPGWREKPSWYLLAENDRVIAAATQRFFIARMGATANAQPVDHTPLSSAPVAVAAVIARAAAAVAAQG